MRLHHAAAPCGRTMRPHHAAAPCACTVPTIAARRGRRGASAARRPLRTPQDLAGQRADRVRSLAELTLVENKGGIVQTLHSRRAAALFDAICACEQTRERRKRNWFGPPSTLAEADESPGAFPLPKVRRASSFDAGHAQMELALLQQLRQRQAATGLLSLLQTVDSQSDWDATVEEYAKRYDHSYEGGPASGLRSGGTSLLGKLAALGIRDACESTLRSCGIQLCHETRVQWFSGLGAFKHQSASKGSASPRGSLPKASPTGGSPPAPAAKAAAKDGALLDSLKTLAPTVQRRGHVGCARAFDSAANWVYSRLLPPRHPTPAATPDSPDVGDAAAACGAPPAGGGSAPAAAQCP
eukprot:gene8775-16369_t